jgi:hypothetical protein
MSDNRHNGWTNYETWACALWLDNDQGTQEHMQELTKQACRDAIGETAHYAACQLSESIKAMVEDTDMGCPDLGCTLYADLLNAALSSINYYEIAKNYVDDSGRFDEESEVA